MAHQASNYELATAELVVWYQADHSQLSPGAQYSAEFSDFEKQIQRQAEVLEELLLESDEIEPRHKNAPLVN